MIERAIHLVEEGKVEQAIQLLEGKLEHATHQEKYDIAQMFFEWGLLEQAKDIVKELIFLYPGEGDLYMLLAEILIDLDEEEEAIDMLNEIKSDDPTYVQSLLLLADLYQMQGLDEVAERKLLEAKKGLPDEPIIDFGLGEFYLAKADYPSALSYYEKVIQSQDTIGGININLRMAEALSMSGKFEEAFECYQKGLDQTTEIDALFGFAFTAIRIENYKTAIKTLTELKEIDPDYHSLYLPLAKAYKEEGALEEAYSTVNEGIARDEYNKELYLLKGQISYELKEVDQAIKDLRHALVLDPEFIAAQRTLIDLFFNEEMYEEVVELAEYMSDYQSADPRLEWDLAKAKNQLEMFDKAINHYQAAYNSYKDNDEFLVDYGYFLMEEGLREDAKEIFKQALSINPSLYEVEALLLRLEEEPF